jgi:hypothetical protein
MQKKYFYTGYGVNLQFHDSTVIEKVMLRMIKEYDAVTLPIHDSLITQYQYGSELKSCMEDEFKVFTGGSCKVIPKNIAEYCIDRLKSLKENYVMRIKNAGLKLDPIKALKG